MSEKPKLALYWAASCGGCEIAVLDLSEKILDVANAFDIVFWPVAMDFKTKDVEAMEDKSIDVCLFNGAIRTSDNEYMAKLLRQKSKVLVAFGSCSYGGGIPALANLKTLRGIMERVYLESPSTVNPEKIFPKTHYQVPEGEIELPELYEDVRTLPQTVDVEYFVPGCAPNPDRIWDVVQAVVSGALPPAGSVVGAFEKTVCDECHFNKEEKKVKKFVRPHQVIPDTNRCLLEQGILCLGVATRGGCGAKCTNVNMPCRGCYGPAEGVADQGAKFLSAVASMVDSQDEAEIKEILKGVVDPVGTAYRFHLAASLLHKARSQEIAGEKALAAAKH
ncbi:MAG: oxidoreductase [Chloroflexi bacterium]|nr:oxidoreductase [Chloroflexota bacterium]